MLAEEFGHVQGKSPDKYTLTEGHSQPLGLWEQAGGQARQTSPTWTSGAAVETISGASVEGAR